MIQIPDRDSADTKRVLSLDGGGIRGVISLGILEQIESDLRSRAGREDLVLADEFDLIAGTSTGAIIAACLSWGMTVGEVLGLYQKYGRQMFSPARLLHRFRARYRGETIASMFREIFTEPNGEIARLGSGCLRTLVLIVVRNASTGSPWPLTNNPRAMYNQRGIPGCNLDIPLWQLLRASTAAPTFFPPERIPFGEESFTFMDGGVTPYNNPALIALLSATLPQYRIDWPSGPERLHLVSIGTGAVRSKLSPKPVDRLNLIDHAKYVPPALMESINEQQDFLCRVLGECVLGDVIDSEVGDLIGVPGSAPRDKLCRYLRLNPRLTNPTRLDAVGDMEDLVELGRAYMRSEPNQA